MALSWSGVIVSDHPLVPFPALLRPEPPATTMVLVHSADARMVTDGIISANFLLPTLTRLECSADTSNSDKSLPKLATSVIGNDSLLPKDDRTQATLVFTSDLIV